jgi:hypothetical protein
MGSAPLRGALSAGLYPAPPATILLSTVKRYYTTLPGFCQESEEVQGQVADRTQPRRNLPVRQPFPAETHTAHLAARIRTADKDPRG